LAQLGRNDTPVLSMAGISARELGSANVDQQE